MTRLSWRGDAMHIGTLAGPLVLTQLAQVALGTTQVVVLGQLGTLDLAAGGLAMSLFNFLRTMGVGLVTPTGNLVAEAAIDADRHPQRLRELSRASFAVATLAGLLFWLVMAAGAPLLAFAGQDAQVARHCALYLAAAAPGMLPLLWFQALRNITVGLRKPGPLLAITVASVGVNLVLNLVLTRGIGSWPGLGLGLVGVALSGSLVNLLAFGAFWALARRDPAVSSVMCLKVWATPLPALRQTLRLGLPVAATYGSEAGFFSLLGLMAGSFGAAALAAHTVVNQAVYVVFMVAVGLSHGVSISISPAWAQGQSVRARRLAWTGLAMGWLAMAGVALLYGAAPELVLQAFLGHSGMTAEVASLGASLLALAAWLQFFDCSQNIAIGMLRGVGETGSAFVRTLIGYWGVGLPAAWLLSVPGGLGVRGLWIGLMVGLGATCLQLLLRFAKVTRPSPAKTLPRALVEGETA